LESEWQRGFGGGKNGGLLYVVEWFATPDAEPDWPSVLYVKEEYRVSMPGECMAFGILSGKQPGACAQVRRQVTPVRNISVRKQFQESL